MTVALCVPRRWQSTSGTLFHSFLPANWSASQKKQSTRTESSSFAILASSRLPARRSSFEETVRFEKIHEETYRDFGFELVSVEPSSLVERVSIIKAAIR